VVSEPLAHLLLLTKTALAKLKRADIRNAVGALRFFLGTLSICGFSIRQ
jgi:hypothetical protein